MQHQQRIQHEFKKQAAGFAQSDLTLNRGEYIDWIVTSLQLRSDARVLDVAAGTGILSRAMAPHVHEIIAVDITEDMIQEGLRQNELSGTTNISYHRADVASLPFDEGTFDVVVCRFAFHHFTDPGQVLGEMARVCKSSGQVAVVDMISSEDPLLYERYNHYERLRDPSHTFCPRPTELAGWFAEHGMQVSVAEHVTVNVNVAAWLTLTQTPSTIRSQIEQEIRNELTYGGPVTGMEPFQQDDALMFKQHWTKMMAVKP